MAATQNPTISQSGTASIGSQDVCTWETKNGSSSTMTISNTGSNSLSLVISNAPDSVQGYENGEKVDLNGLFTIKPNTPTYTIVGYGDFKGQSVSIQNNTPESVESTGSIVCVVQG